MESRREERKENKQGDRLGERRYGKKEKGEEGKKWERKEETGKEMSIETNEGTEDKTTQNKAEERKVAKSKEKEELRLYKHLNKASATNSFPENNDPKFQQTLPPMTVTPTPPHHVFLRLVATHLVGMGCMTEREGDMHK